jgi:hypothetical protein
MKRHILSLFLAVAMMLTVVPRVAITVGANTSNLLAFGVMVTSTFTETNGMNRYQVILSEPGRLTVEVNNRDVTLPIEDRNVVVRWLNEDGTIVRDDSGRNDWAVGLGVSFPYSQAVILEAGTYFIEVERNAGKTGTHTIVANFVAAKNNETEPNNSRPNAQTIAFGQSVTGLFSFQDEVDIYRVALPTAGRLTVEINNRDTALPIGSGNVFVQWLNEDGTVAITDGGRSDWAVGLGVNFPYSRATILEAGTYFIEVGRNAGQTGTYTIVTDFVAAGNNEVEPNNTRPNAQAIEFGQSVVGLFSFQDEIDIYRVVLPTAGQLTVEVNNRDITLPIEDRNVVVRWLNGNGTRIRADGGQSDWAVGQGVRFPYIANDT